MMPIHTDIVRVLAEDFGFPSTFVWVRSRPTIADLHSQARRCGIYVLRFADGQYYVGQAVDVTRRYVQHLKTHDDIEAMAFRYVPQRDLNVVEQRLVQSLEERQVSLRNKALTSLPKGDHDLDDVVPRSEQDAWLDLRGGSELQAQTIIDPIQRDKYTHRFRRLLRDARFDSRVREFLREYLSRCILQPTLTERSFWALTCLTDGGYFAGSRALVRISLYWADALSVWYESRDDGLRYSFRATKSLLPSAIKRSLKVSTLKTIPISGNARGGPDQIYVEVDRVADAMALLQNDRFVSAVKTLNLRLMQMGPTSYARNHCLDLSHHILSAGWRPPTGAARPTVNLQGTGESETGIGAGGAASGEARRVRGNPEGRVLVGGRGSALLRPRSE